MWEIWFYSPRIQHEARFYHPRTSYRNTFLQSQSAIKADVDKYRDLSVKYYENAIWRDLLFRHKMQDYRVVMWFDAF